MPKTKREIAREVDTLLASGPQRDVSKRLFIGVYPTGISYADRSRLRHGDYLTVARLPYRTLKLEWEPGVPVSLDLREAIERDARLMQSRRGQRFETSSSGQYVILGQ